MDLFDWQEPQTPVAGPTLPELNPRQAKFIDEGRKAYSRAKRVIWQAPCGSGKTYVAAWQTKLALGMGKTVLHIVHRRRLCDQMIDTLRRFGIAASPIMEGRCRWESQVMCASRDTLLSMLDQGVDLPRPDLICFDEAHVASMRVQDWYLANCPNAYWSGWTASPVRPNGLSLNPPYQALVSMGQTSDMIADGRLCHVKVFNPDAVGVRRRKGEKVKPVGDPIAHWRKYANGLPTVVFAATVAESRQIVARYREAGVTAEHMDAQTSDEEREAIFERSRQGLTTVIANCAVLIEGVNLPWLVCCQILRGCNSLVLWMQSTGRIMRTFEGKECGIVLDHSGAAHEFGMPDADFNWQLGTAAQNTKHNVPKEKRPVTCPKCSLVFLSKPICPECGHVMPRPKRKETLASQLSTEDGILTEFTDGQTKHRASDVAKRIWERTLFIGRAKGWKMRQCLAVFKKQTGVPPWKANMGVQLPNGAAGWDMPAGTWIEMRRN